MPNTELIPTGKIRTDGGTQPRAKINMETCLDYAEQMKSGDRFPPVEVYFDGQHYWLADGFHRYFAHRNAHPGEPIEAVVYQGTREDAQWHSYGVNKTHGLRRTNKDKERAVKAALLHPKGAELSDRQIALHVGVTPPTVAKYRRELGSTIKTLQSPQPQAAVTTEDQAGGTGELPPSPNSQLAGVHGAKAPLETPAASRQAGESEKATVPNHRQGQPRYRTGRDGRTINTARIGRKRKSVSGGKPSRHMARLVSQPTRSPRPAPEMTALSLPRDPEMGARTLIELFDTDYLHALVDRLVELLSEA